MKILYKSKDPLVKKTARILKREHIKRNPGSTVTVNLNLDRSVEKEGYRIEGTGENVAINGGDPRGVLYGAGKFLRDPEWRGHSVPEKKFRGMYFATHFYNFYHVAPISEIKKYIDELALWGHNFLIMWFDMHHYQSIRDPEAKKMLKRLYSIYEYAQEMGMATGLGAGANEAYASSPEELRADWTAGHDGYFKELCAHYHLEICPNKPGGAELILKWRKEYCEYFKKLKTVYFSISPYDQGGCTCAKCAPWGANGYLKMAEPIARMARRYFPDAKICLSSWYFDHFIKGEWEGVSRIFKKKKPDWVDMIMADDYGKFPAYPLKHGVPGNFPLTNFFEITMQKAFPWGAFGANPYPEVLTKIWGKIKNLTSGGFPYSEGLSEDLNKIICAGFYWDKKKSADRSIKEYLNYYFSPAASEDLFKAVKILEKTLDRHLEGEGKAFRVVIHKKALVKKALVLVEKAEKKMPKWAKADWRWKIIKLRAIIDSELVKKKGKFSSKFEAASRELTRIYYADKAIYAVTPLTKKARKKFFSPGSRQDM